MKRYAESLGIVLFSLIVIVSTQALADDVKVINANEASEYINVPMIKKTFRGAPPESTKAALTEKCKSWVSATLKTLENSRVQDSYCEYEADSIVREFVFTGYVIMKNW